MSIADFILRGELTQSREKKGTFYHAINATTKEENTKRWLFLETNTQESPRTAIKTWGLTNIWLPRSLSLQNMWSKNKDNVVWHKDGRTEVFNEAGLRHVIREYLSDESRARYSPGKFMDEEFYLMGLKHLLEGLSLFYK